MLHAPPALGSVCVEHLQLPKVFSGYLVSISCDTCVQGELSLYCSMFVSLPGLEFILGGGAAFHHHFNQVSSSDCHL